MKFRKWMNTDVNVAEASKRILKALGIPEEDRRIVEISITMNWTEGMRVLVSYCPNQEAVDEIGRIFKETTFVEKTQEDISRPTMNERSTT